ncbi:MAG: hypothetical protein QXF17_05745 [Ignisphaera sp.]
MRRQATFYADANITLFASVEWLDKAEAGEVIPSPAEYYRLEPTATALALLEAPFTWKVSRRVSNNGNTVYKCWAFFPATSTHAAYNACVEVVLAKKVIMRELDDEQTLPTNMGPFRPLWYRLVKHWLRAINNLDPAHVNRAGFRLLKMQLINYNMLGAIEWA